jgi:putative colanic acid biosynthesis acetyltransferase WcaF
VILKKYNKGSFYRGSSIFIEAIWYFLQALFVSSAIPGSSHRRWLLRLFGAQIDKGVVIRPGVKVKFPWRLSIGAYSWIGEGVWIDNLAQVAIADNVCISQGAYFCTGSHNWALDTFDLIVKPINIESACWIAAFAKIGPGVTAHKGAVLTLGSCAYHDLGAWTINSGTPSIAIRNRNLQGVRPERCDMREP